LLHNPGFIGVPFGVIKFCGGAEGLDVWAVSVPEEVGDEAGRFVVGTPGEGVLEPGGERAWLERDKFEGGGEL